MQKRKEMCHNVSQYTNRNIANYNAIRDDTVERNKCN